VYGECAAQCGGVSLLQLSAVDIGVGEHQFHHFIKLLPPFFLTSFFPEKVTFGRVSSRVHLARVIVPICNATVCLYFVLIFIPFYLIHLSLHSPFPPHGVLLM